MPELSLNKVGGNKHTHFIASAIRDSSIRNRLKIDEQVWNRWNLDKGGDSYADCKNKTKFTDGPPWNELWRPAKPAVMRLATEAWRGSESDSDGYWSANGFNNFWPNSGRPSFQYDSPYSWHVNAWCACFFFSQPQGVNNSGGTPKYRATKGRSSNNINDNPQQNNGNIFDIDGGQKYPNEELIGYENSPEYVACLPFIKI